MQDNAPIPKAEKVKKWFQEQGIPLLDWPPYSPDLNPIEHCWVHIKQWILDNYPELQELGESQEAFDRLAIAIQQAWQAISEEKIRECIKSMNGPSSDQGKRMAYTILAALGLRSKKIIKS
jgi:transposase